MKKLTRYLSESWLMLKFIVRDKIKASPMEKILEKSLKTLKLKYFKEVEFESCINPKTKCNLRYDFYIPKLKVLIEYDGKMWHDKEDVKFRDSIKNHWAYSNGLNLYRVTGAAQIKGLIENLKLERDNVLLESKIRNQQEKKLPSKKSQRPVPADLEKLKPLNPDSKPLSTGERAKLLSALQKKRAAL